MKPHAVGLAASDSSAQRASAASGKLRAAGPRGERQAPRPAVGVWGGKPQPSGPAPATVPQKIPNPSSVTELSRDFRFVAMCCEHYHLDWQMGACAGVDYWSRAESFIAKRRSGEIDALQYEILVDESKNLA
ncbi:hypothetical protein C8R44DRAFT_892893 [Mycena epipterygia]|nr:hypothetical protein C8R44DRAFT_892893 [Mycena epipterygia]